jgi:hypothetical protein
VWPRGDRADQREVLTNRWPWRTGEEARDCGGGALRARVTEERRWHFIEAVRRGEGVTAVVDYRGSRHGHDMAARGGDVQRRATNCARRRGRPSSGRVPRGTVQGTHLRHTQEPGRGARTAGRWRARTTRYDSGPTSRTRSRSSAKTIWFSPFDQVYLQNFELKCTNMIIPKL